MRGPGGWTRRGSWRRKKVGRVDVVEDCGECGGLEGREKGRVSG
jgi:hypothetical protein